MLGTPRARPSLFVGPSGVTRRASGFVLGLHEAQCGCKGGHTLRSEATPGLGSLLLPAQVSAAVTCRKEVGLSEFHLVLLARSLPHCLLRERGSGFLVGGVGLSSYLALEL